MPKQATVELTLTVLGAAIAVFAVYLAVLATYVVLKDPLLELGSRIGQTIFSWIVPILGPAVVIRLALDHSPDLISPQWVPWPMRKAMAYSRRQPNALRDDDHSQVEIDP